MKNYGLLRIEKVVNGLSVACPVGECWYRAEVLSVSGPDAFVHFVDNGKRDYVKTSQLRYLKKSFTSQHRHCAKGSLFKVKPKRNEALWDLEAIMRFMDKVKDKTVYASITSGSNDIYLLSLYSDLSWKPNIASYMLLEEYAEIAA